MKVFICSKNRAGVFTIPSALLDRDRFQITVVLHNEEQEAIYRTYGMIPDDIPIVLSHSSMGMYGKIGSMELVANTLVQPGEWFIFADDNIRAITGVHPMYSRNTTLETNKIIRTRETFHSNWREIYSHVYCPKEFEEHVANDITVAESINAHMIGFATNDNPYFRSVKYRPVGYVSGKLLVWKADPNFTWDHEISMEDHRNTAEHLRMYGSVLIDNFIWPQAKHYQPGGLGPYRDRVPARLKDVPRLMATYPGLFRVKNRTGFILNTDLGVRLTTSKQVAEWRDSMRLGDELERLRGTGNVQFS